MATDQGGRPAAGHEHLPPVGFVLLFAITLFWGANWPAMKLGLTEIPVWSFRTICLIGGGGGLLIIARLGGVRLGVPRRELGPLLLCAVFNVVGWHLFTGYGLTYEADDIARIANWLANDGGTFDGEPVLDTTMLDASLQRLPDVSGLRAGSDVIEWPARFARTSDTVDPKTRTIGAIVAVDGAYLQATPGRRPSGCRRWWLPRLRRPCGGFRPRETCC